MGCTADDVIAALRAGADVVAAHRDELVEMDREIGDADHGENMDRGFRAVVAKLDTSPPDTPAAALKLAATVLISSVGGASGPLYGTAFLRAASAAGEFAEFDGSAIATVLTSGLDGVVARGHAEVGDKTMVDVLAPAAETAGRVAESGADQAEVLRAAAQAAEVAAENTRPLVARKGRASYLGERSAGHVDPGAYSTALLLGAFAESAEVRS